MHVPSPVPVACAALGAAAPGVLAAGHAVARRLGLPRAIELTVTPGLALALWLVTTHAIAYAAGAFLPGLVGGTLLVAVGGAAAALLDRGSPRAPGRAPSGAVALLALLATALITPMALRWSFHDEVTTAGHLALASAIQNGAYPPRYPTFPQFELRYHYGFDVVLAAVAAVTRLRIDRAADAITLAAWAYTAALLWALGDRPMRRARGALTAALVLFGGGMPLFCDRPLPAPAPLAVGLCDVEALWINPPIVSYFFQHPWTIGLPLGVCFLLVLLDGARRGAPRVLALALLLVALALAEIVLFYALGAVMVAVEAARRRGLGSALALALALVVSRRMGGFFATAPPGAVSGIVHHLGVVETLWGTVRWHLGTFGLALPLGLAGLCLRVRGRTALVLLLAGGLAVPNLARFESSWDIVKFSVLAALALGALGSEVLARLGSARRPWLARPLGAALFVAAVAPGLVFAGVFAFEPVGLPVDLFPRTPVLLWPPEDAAVTWLRGRVGRDELVFTSRTAARAYAAWGGLGAPWVENDTRAFGFSAELLDARERLTLDLPDAPEAYLAEGIRWFAVDSSEPRLVELTGAWIARGRARVAAEFDDLRVVELLPGDGVGGR